VRGCQTLNTLTPALSPWERGRKEWRFSTFFIAILPPMMIFSAMTHPHRITIETLGARGDGIGHLEDGRRVFVPGALPGEVITFIPGEKRDDGISAELDVINTPSPDRIAPACRHFERCGGCVLQHMSAESYAALKMGQVRAALERENIKIENIEGPFISAPATRRRATMAAFQGQDKMVLGFNEARSNTIVDLEECPVLIPRLSALIPGLREVISKVLTQGQGMDVSMVESGGAVDIVLRPWTKKKSESLLPMFMLERLSAFAQKENIARLSWQNSSTDETDLTPIAWREPFILNFSGVEVVPPPGAFLQATAEGEATLVRLVLDALGAGKKKPKLVADLYAGCGTFTFAIAQEKYRVHAVEGFAPAMAALKNSTRGFAITTEKRDLMHDPLMPKEMKDYDAVIMDPPRVGAGEQAKKLARSEVPLVISVSCGLTSFVKDAATLIAGGYVFEKLSVVDQFLWSPHVEMVGVFRRPKRQY